MKLLVCDDDVRAARQIADLIEQNAKKCELSAEIVLAVEKKDIGEIDIAAFDIAFLDVDLGDSTGLNVAKRFRDAQTDTIIIFVTNYIEYAPAGYEVRAFRYILKSSLEETLPAAFDAAVLELEKARKVLSFSIFAEKTDVPLKNVLYLESDGRFLILHTVAFERSNYRFYGNMTQVSERLEPAGFLRVQKSYLVNMEYIELFQYGKVRLRGGVELHSSEKNHKQLKHRYIMWRGRTHWNIG